MAKVKEKEVKVKLEQWADLQEKIGKAEIVRNKKLDPLQREFHEKTKPILEACELKTQGWKQQSNLLESEIKALVEADRDADGNPKPITISTDTATAVVEKKVGARVVNVKKYFDFVKVKTDAFWKSLKVTIKDAEPIVGKNKIDDLSDKKTEFITAIRLK